MHDRATNAASAGPSQEHSFGVPGYCDWRCIAMTTVRIVVVHAVCGRLYVPGAAR